MLNSSVIIWFPHSLFLSRPTSVSVFCYRNESLPWVELKWHFTPKTSKSFPPFGAGVKRRAVYGPDSGHKSLLMYENLMYICTAIHVKTIKPNQRITDSLKNWLSSLLWNTFESSWINSETLGSLGGIFFFFLIEILTIMFPPDMEDIFLLWNSYGQTVKLINPQTVSYFCISYYRIAQTLCRCQTFFFFFFETFSKVKLRQKLFQVFLMLCRSQWQTLTFKTGKHHRQTNTWPLPQHTASRRVLNLARRE